MKKRKIFTILTILFLVSGCNDRIELEKTAISLILAIDIDDEDNIHVYTTYPVFSEEAKDKVEVLSTFSKSLREARTKFDTMSDLHVIGGKLQLIILSKDVLAKKNARILLDVLYRDPKNPINAYVAVSDTPISELIHFKSDSKPRLAIFLKGLMKTSNSSNQTALTTLGQFRYQLVEKGITPIITTIEMKNGDINIPGSSLLDNEGKVITYLNPYQNSLLLLLKEEQHYPVPLNITLTKDESNIPISFNIGKSNLKTNIDYRDAKFHFNQYISLDIHISNYDELNNIDDSLNDIANSIEVQLEKDIEELYTHLKENQLDPLGLGLYARAFYYPIWKEVQDDWGNAFSDAETNIIVDVKIKDHGLLK